MDAGPHTFYLLRWLFGDVTELQAFHSRAVSASEVEDNALVLGRLANGAEFVSQFTFTAEAPWTERLEIYGTHAALIIDQLCNPPALLYYGTGDYGGRTLAVPYDIVNWKYRSIVTEVKDFIRVVWHGGTPAVDPMDAYYGLLLIEKAYQSAAAGQRLPV